MSPLSGKVAIVTGGASGIGRASALALAGAGARVAIADINEAGAHEVVAEIGRSGGEGLAIGTDVSEPLQIERMVQTVAKRFGRIDVLDNNAADLGLLADDLELLSDRSTVDVWDRTYRANQRSVMVACKHVLPHMIRNGGGSIINISSVDALLGDNSRFAYAMAKSAINVLTQCVATTYGKHGIRCNAIAPGLIMTPMATANVGPVERKIWEANIPSPALGKPDEIGSVVVFLASDAASYVNGQVIVVDGGLLSHVPHLAQFEALARSSSSSA